MSAASYEEYVQPPGKMPIAATGAWPGLTIAISIKTICLHRAYKCSGLERILLAWLSVAPMPCIRINRHDQKKDLLCGTYAVIPIPCCG